MSPRTHRLHLVSQGEHLRAIRRVLAQRVRLKPHAFEHGLALSLLEGLAHHLGLVEPGELDQVSERIRYMHYSLKTEKAYLYWVRFFIRWSAS